MKRYLLTPLALLALFFIAVVACQTKGDQAAASEKSDLASFPTDWVLIVNSTPDSIIAKMKIPVNTDSSFYGQLTVDPAKMALVYKDFDTVLEYDIVNCKIANEGDVVYYKFKLINKPTKDSASLNVNFRVMPDNPQSSVFFFADKEGKELKTIELVTKAVANKFPHVATEGYD